MAASRRPASTARSASRAARRALSGPLVGAAHGVPPLGELRLALLDLGSRLLGARAQLLELAVELGGAVALERLELAFERRDPLRSVVALDLGAGRRAQPAQLLSGAPATAPQLLGALTRALEAQ